MLQPLHIPKCCRQARSRKAHPPRQGSSVESSKHKNGAYSITTASTDQGSDDLVSRNKEEMRGGSLFRCIVPWNEKHKGIILKSIDIPVIGVKSVTENASLDSSNNGLQLSVPGTHNTLGSLPSTPDKSMLPTGGSVDAWLAPGNVVWAKTAYHQWWPAEVMDEKGDLQCSNDQHIGLVLVQLYGNHEYAWLDPVGDLSQFDYCYDDRSKNPLKAFQDALNQALWKHARASPRIPSVGCSGEIKSLIQHEQPFDTWKTPSSSRTKDECNDEGRGKRKRKQKTHFDDLTSPTKPTRRMRRLRIMRSLGLAAPVGSPFSLPHGRTV